MSIGKINPNYSSYEDNILKNEKSNIVILKKAIKTQLSKSTSTSSFVEKKTKNIFVEKPHKSILLYNLILKNLNKTLYNSELLIKKNKKISHIQKPKLVLSQSDIELIKKEKYEKRCSAYLPKLKERRNSTQYLFNLQKTSFDCDNYINRRRPIYNYKGEKLIGLTNYVENFELPKKKLKPSQIVKKSWDIIYENKKYKNKDYLSDEVDNLVKSNDDYSNYYDFDKQVKEYIKEEETGIKIPGNMINRNKFGCAKTLQPHIVKLKIKKKINLNESTYLPAPRGLVNAKDSKKFTRITINQIYNNKSLLI